MRSLVSDLSVRSQKAAQITAAARVANDTSAVQMATEITARAERRLGQLLEESPKAAPGRKPHQEIGAAPEPITPTLAQLGISKKLSARSRQLARGSEEQFEEAISATKEVAAEVTAASIIGHRRQGR